mmetsp:Transcript_60039/g.152046  ORF Transcript_60039/g.152046 Transcript_60039/m.152046 type:complete len:253 (+) Transcript_60039:742-1500(+)
MPPRRVEGLAQRTLREPEGEESESGEADRAEPQGRALVCLWGLVPGLGLPVRRRPLEGSTSARGPRLDAAPEEGCRAHRGDADRTVCEGQAVGPRRGLGPCQGALPGPHQGVRRPLRRRRHGPPPVAPRPLGDRRLVAPPVLLAGAGGLAGLQGVEPVQRRLVGASGAKPGFGSRRRQGLQAVDRRGRRDLALGHSGHPLGRGGRPHQYTRGRSSPSGIDGDADGALGRGGAGGAAGAAGVHEACQVLGGVL